MGELDKFDELLEELKSSLNDFSTTSSSRDIGQVVQYREMTTVINTADLAYLRGYDVLGNFLVGLMQRFQVEELHPSTTSKADEVIVMSDTAHLPYVTAVLASNGDVAEFKRIVGAGDGKLNPIQVYQHVQAKVKGRLPSEVQEWGAIELAFFCGYLGFRERLLEYRNMLGSTPKTVE